MKMVVFWIVVLLCSLVEVYRRFRGACYLHYQASIIVMIMMEAASTSETSANFYQITWSNNNPEDSHLHTRRRENLKSH
jgi:hypothetical protein